MPSDTDGPGRWMDGQRLPPLRWADVDGPVAYREWEGPPETTFVMLHGLGGSSLNWIRVAPGLASRGRVLAPDLPGFGRSPRSGRDTGLDDQRRWVAGFLEAVRGAGTERVVVCGNSMGGAIAGLLAAEHPDAVDGLILTSSVLPWAWGGVPNPLVLASFGLTRIPHVGERIARARRRHLDPERTVHAALAMAAVDPSRIPEEVVELHVELVERLRDEPGAVEAFTQASRSIVDYLLADPREGRRTLGRIRCPVLLVHGRQDRFIPVAFAEAVLAEHPRWRGRLLGGVGHAGQLEVPGRWLDEVLAWDRDRAALPSDGAATG